MFDDGGRFDDCLSLVEQQRELAERPIALQLHHEWLGIDDLELPVLELGPVAVEGNENLLRIRGEGVAEENEAHQVPASICSRLPSSTSLGSRVANEPVGTSPAGS